MNLQFSKLVGSLFNLLGNIRLPLIKFHHYQLVDLLLLQRLKIARRLFPSFQLFFRLIVQGDASFGPLEPPAEARFLPDQSQKDYYI